MLNGKYCALLCECLHFLENFNPDIHIDMPIKTKIFLSSKISGYSVRLSHSYPCLGLSAALGSYDSWKSKDFGSRK